MSLAKRFTSGLIWNSAGKIVLYLLGIATSVAIARGLGKVELGFYATLLTVPTILRLFSSLGFETIFNIKLPAFSVLQGGKKMMRYLIRSLMLLRLVTVVIILVGLYFLLPSICLLMKKPKLVEYFPPIALYFTALVMVSLSSMIFRALLKMKVLFVFDGLNQAMNLAAIIVFLWVFGLGINGVLYAFIISTMITICFYCFVGREYFFGETKPVERRGLYGIGATALASSLVTFGLGVQIDIILLNYFGVISEKIGFYHLGYGLAVMLGLFSQGIGGISQSVFSEAYARQGSSGLGISWSMITKVFILMALPIYVFALFYTAPIFRIFYGTEYVGAAGILQVFIISISIRIIVGSSFCMPAFYLLNQKRKGVLVQVGGGLTNLVLDLLLIPFYGVWGAVAATALSLAMTGIVQMVILSRKIKVFPPLFFAGKIVVACLVALIPTFLFTPSNICILFVVGIIYCSTFLIMMSILKPLGEEEKKMVSMVNPQLAAVVNYF